MSSDDDPAPPGGGTVTHDKQHQQTASHSPTATAPPTSDTKGPRGNGDAAPPPKPMPIDTPSSAATSDSNRSLSRPSGLGSGSSGSAFWQSGGMLTSEPSSAESQTANSPAIHTQQQYPLRPSRWTKARSTSTESSISISGMTTLGSMYNQDGFPNYPVSSDDDHEITRLTMDDAAIAKQVALTDEAVRQINGTQSVVQARSMASMMPAPVSGRTYELPRSMAAYVGPRRTDETRNDLGAGRSFVSSGSSTSSEESEHLASVQWVKQAVQSPSYPPFGPYFHSAPQPRPTSPKMPPPPTNARHMPSPRRNGSSGLPNTQHTGGPGFAPPPLNANRTGNSADSGGDNEDDDQTVGFREGSPSSSSASGLDLLSHAAAHHERSHDRPRYSTQVKRKAGAEAVAQWRESGIPTGSPRVSDVRAVSAGYDSPGYESTLSDGQSRERETPVEPPKKRRRSEMKLEAPDARLRQPPPSDGHESDLDYETDHSDGSEYRGGGPGVGGGTKVRRPSAGSRAKAKKNPAPRVRGADTLPLAGPPAKTAKADGPKKGGGRKSSPTASSAKGSNSSRRLSNTTDDKTGGVGVQCEYVNPLPPYQRCPDVFTRKYDIPRHMARHARREGDLVQEGKLPEEKALLWKTIRDKPRIHCKTCGEFFTRQDALKRHQSKQHHH